MTGTTIVVVAATAAMTSGLLTYAMSRLLLVFRVLDVPNERSSHSYPVVRGAGIAMAATWMTVVCLFLLSTRVHAPSPWALIPMVGALTALGLVDDAIRLPAGTRLAAQVVICGLGVASGVSSPVVALVPGVMISLGWAASPTWVVFLVALVNLFNFMDGIDGLVAGQTALSALALAVVADLAHLPTLTVFAVAAVAVTVGFLPFNWSPAHCFMGDAGSYFCGGALSGMWVVGQQKGLSLLAMALPAVVFLLDAVTTVIRRVVRGRAPWRAHREHLYQRLTSAGWTHARVSLTYLWGASVGLVVDVALAIGQVAL